MPHFFAEFRQLGQCWVRHNTRIYLADFAGNRPVGQCVGAIVAKNPGSAKSACEGWGALDLDGDKMLPNVRNMLLQAFVRAKKSPLRNAYFQVLNLFYICDQNLKQATKLLQADNPYRDLAESMSFPIIWFAWGGPSPKLDDLKDRFRSMQFAHAFYYSPATESVVPGLPSKSVLAKHPQGMHQEPVIAHLAAHL